MASFNETEWRNERIKNVKPFLDDISSLLDFLIETSFAYPEIVFLKGSKIFVQNQFTLSLERTFSNIKLLLFRGTYSDAFTLLRKFRDDFLLYLIVLFEATNTNKTFTGNFSFEELLNNPEKVLGQYFYDIYEHDDVLKERGAIKGWVKNENTKKTIDYSMYLLYLKRNTEISRLLMDYGFEDKLKTADKVLNGYTHSAGESLFKQNVTHTFSQEKIDELNAQFKTLLTSILVFLLLALAHIKPVALSIIIEPEDMSEGESARYSMDCRALDFFSKYTEKGVWKYIAENTNFDDFPLTF